MSKTTAQLIAELAFALIKLVILGALLFALHGSVSDGEWAWAAVTACLFLALAIDSAADRIRDAIRESA